MLDRDGRRPFNTLRSYLLVYKPHFQVDKQFTEPWPNRILGRTYVGVKLKKNSLDLKGRFYANLSVLYLTTRFCAMNVSVCSRI